MDDNKIKYCPYCGHNLGSFQISTDSNDALYNNAVKLVISSGRASTSFIQKNFKVGYVMAARTIDRMEKNGVISPAEGTKPRKVLAKKIH